MTEFKDLKIFGELAPIVTNHNNWRYARQGGINDWEVSEPLIALKQAIARHRQTQVEHTVQTGVASVTDQAR